MSTAVSVDLESPETSRAGGRTFLRLANEWQLTVDQQAALLGLDIQSLEAWKQGDGRKMGTALITRLSYVLGIYRALNTLFPTHESAAQ